jgi:hypothetical protein
LSPRAIDWRGQITKANAQTPKKPRSFATKEHIELKERFFSAFFVILRGYTLLWDLLFGV